MEKTPHSSANRMISGIMHSSSNQSTPNADDPTWPCAMELNKEKVIQFKYFIQNFGFSKHSAFIFSESFKLMNILILILFNIYF